MKYSLYLFMLLLFSCIDRNHSFTTKCFVPVYASESSINNIGVEAAKLTDTAGKIYVYKDYAFQIEKDKGIHIIADAKTAQAHKIAFLRVPYCSEISIKNDYLYTNNSSDVVVFSLSNPNSPTLVKRLKDVFHLVNQLYPPFNNVYFECPDPSKGIVVNWVEKQIPDPKCRR